MSRSSFFTGLVALCLFAPIGCAATAPEDGGETIAETQDELSIAGRGLVGKYYDHRVPFAGIARISLESNGKYSAQVEAGGRAFCITSPCLLPESGTWIAVKGPNNRLRLVLRADGQVARSYDARKGNGQLELTRDGKTQTLIVLDADQCLDSKDCRADEECAPKVCFMHCLVGDPFCCGPSRCEPKAPAPKMCGGFAAIPCSADEECVDNPTDDCDPNKGGADCAGICQPKAPPPPPCWGAWLDRNGVCRTPADGVYPASCCERGPKCGDAQCAAGEVCCNSLAGICTKPGQLCAF